jgi:hypothetical protein
MAPKCKPTTCSRAQPKKQRSVLTLQGKLAVLGKLRNGMSVSNVAHKCGRNIIYTNILQRIVLYGRSKGFSRVSLAVRDYGFTLRLSNVTRRELRLHCSIQTQKSQPFCASFTANASDTVRVFPRASKPEAVEFTFCRYFQSYFVSFRKY